MRFRRLPGSKLVTTLPLPGAQNLQAVLPLSALRPRIGLYRNQFRSPPVYGLKCPPLMPKVLFRAAHGTSKGHGACKCQASEA